MPTGVEEAVGLALGAAGLVAAFKGAVDGYLLIESFFDDDDESGHLCLRYHIEKHKLNIWGDFYKASDPANSRLLSQPEVVKNLIIRALGQIEATHRKADKYVKKHELAMQDVSQSNVNKGLFPGSQLVKTLADSSAAKSARARFRWIVKDKAGFANIVSQLTQLNRDLYGLLQTPNDELLQTTLASYVLANIQNSVHLSMLQDPKTQSSRLLALSAQLKAMKQSATVKTHSPLKLIKSSEIKLRDGNWTTCLFEADNGVSRSCWVDWSVMDPNCASNALSRPQAEALATMLQAVDEPSLHIPPCLGLFEDLDYEAKHGTKRLGFVFTTPTDSHEENLRAFEPVRLKEHIRATRDSPPLLGDRFKLAYTLMTSFSLFHASGWLHKGFRSDNIVFLHKANGQGISVTDPYIIGFQHSRAQKDASLKQNVAKNAEEEYYYHPNVKNGFTKALDLYSLGVVLCEIGRWDLLGDAVPASKKHKLTDRTWAQRFIAGQPLDDLGWRMGARYRDVTRTLLSGTLPGDDDDFFAHEFFKKVIMPLETCTA